MLSGQNVLEISTQRSSWLNIGAGFADILMFSEHTENVRFWDINVETDFQVSNVGTRREEDTEDKETRAFTFPTFINFFIRGAKTKTNKIHNPNISDLKHMHNFALHTLRHKQLYFRNWTTNQASNRKCAKTWRELRDVNSRSTQRENGRAHNSHTTHTGPCHLIASTSPFLLVFLTFHRRHSFIWNQFFFLQFVLEYWAETTQV